LYPFTAHVAPNVLNEHDVEHGSIDENYTKIAKETDAENDTKENPQNVKTRTAPDDHSPKNSSDASDPEGGSPTLGSSAGVREADTLATSPFIAHVPMRVSSYPHSIHGRSSPYLDGDVQRWIICEQICY
jgi:hypothetical protein